MVTALFDTNILIDHFDGIEAATDELIAYDQAYISTITWMEVACGMTPQEIVSFNQLLVAAGIGVIQTSEAIMVEAAAIRRVTRRKLPDCIIRATAVVHANIIVTRNPSDFGGTSPMVRVPYDIVAGVAVNIKSPMS